MRKQYASQRPDNVVKNRERARAARARILGYAAPPLEKDCPPRPRDGLCDSCLNPPKRRAALVMDHDHVTGAFRGWICDGCNSGWSRAGISDDPVELRRRAVEFKDPDKARTRADFLDCKLPWQ
jgi:hypothetical protein